MNYVFYDFETSGLSWYFDQPIQLAAKLVDENFNIIDEFNEKWVCPVSAQQKVVGMTFQVADVKKPLLSVKRIG